MAWYTFRWKSTSSFITAQHQVNEARESHRLAAHAEVPPFSGLETRSGLLRTWTPDTYLPAGTTRFGSGDLTTPASYNADVAQFKLIADRTNRRDSLHFFHGTPEECVHLIEQLNRAETLTNNAVGEALKTAAHNSAVTGAPAAAIGVIVGTLAGGPVGAAIGGGVGTIVGLVIGSATGVAQAIALHTAGIIEKPIKELVQDWALFLDNQCNSLVMRRTLDRAAREDAFKETNPPSVQYLVFQSLSQQLDAIEKEERRLGQAFRVWRRTQEALGEPMEINPRAGASAVGSSRISEIVSTARMITEG